MKNGAGNQVRTGDLNLGKVALYQLSYSRDSVAILMCKLQGSLLNLGKLALHLALRAPLFPREGRDSSHCAPPVKTLHQYFPESAYPSAFSVGHAARRYTIMDHNVMTDAMISNQ